MTPYIGIGKLLPFCSLTHKWCLVYSREPSPIPPTMLFGMLRTEIERPHCRGFGGVVACRLYLTEHLQLVAPYTMSFSLHDRNNSLPWPYEKGCRRSSKRAHPS